jgi:hypothetical protein
MSEQEGWHHLQAAHEIESKSEAFASISRVITDRIRLMMSHTWSIESVVTNLTQPVVERACAGK